MDLIEKERTEEEEEEEEEEVGGYTGDDQSMWWAGPSWQGERERKKEKNARPFFKTGN